MKQGKVIILGGNARSGKTTLAKQLAENGFNRICFDTFTKAIEDGLNINLAENSAEKLYKFFEIIVEKSINEAIVDGVNTVIDMYDFTPEYVSKMPFKDSFEVYFLAYPNCTKEEIKYNVKHYAKPTDWIAQVNEKYLDECAQRFYLRNKLLEDECKKYNYNLINTSYGENRDKVLNELFKKIVEL